MKILMDPVFGNLQEAPALVAIKEGSRIKSPRLRAVVYQGPNQTNQDSIQALLKHEEPNFTRQQQKVINQTPSPSEYTPTRLRGQRLKFLVHKDCRIILKTFILIVNETNNFYA